MMLKKKRVTKYSKLIMLNLKKFLMLFPFIFTVSIVSMINVLFTNNHQTLLTNYKTVTVVKNNYLNLIEIESELAKKLMTMNANQVTYNDLNQLFNQNIELILENPVSNTTVNIVKINSYPELGKIHALTNINNVNTGDNILGTMYNVEFIVDGFNILIVGKTNLESWKIILIVLSQTIIFILILIIIVSIANYNKKFKKDSYDEYDDVLFK